MEYLNLYYFNAGWILWPLILDAQRIKLSVLYQESVSDDRKPVRVTLSSSDTKTLPVKVPSRAKKWNNFLKRARRSSLINSQERETQTWILTQKSVRSACDTERKTTGKGRWSLYPPCSSHSLTLRRPASQGKDGVTSCVTLTHFYCRFVQTWLRDLKTIPDKHCYSCRYRRSSKHDWSGWNSNAGFALLGQSERGTVNEQNQRLLSVFFFKVKSKFWAPSLNC